MRLIKLVLLFYNSSCGSFTWFTYTSVPNWIIWPISDTNLRFCGCVMTLWLSWRSYITSPKNLPNQKSCNLLKIVIFGSFLAITPVWTLVTSLIVPYHLTTNSLNQKLRNLLKIVIFGDFSLFLCHNSSLGLDRDVGFLHGWPLKLPWKFYITSPQIHHTKNHATS